VKKEYIVDPESKKNVVDTGPDLDQDSDDISPNTKQVPEQIPQDIKPEIKGKMLMVHEPVRDTTDKRPEKRSRYEMRPRKSKLSIDLNKPIVEEEHGLKVGSKVKAEVKPKIEANRDIDDNHQVQALKQQNDDMRQQIQNLQQQNQALELQHTKLQKKYQKLQKKHQKTCMFLKEII
jgi:hypothetical protein